MLAKRIIPCLDVKDFRTVKGRQFQNLQDAGDPIYLAWHYCQQGADELVFLDIAASLEARSAREAFVREVARNVCIPFTVGGGIRSVADAASLLECGADKVSVNTAAVKRPDLLDELALEFGSQAVVLAIDSRSSALGQRVCIYGGSQLTDFATLDWAKEAVERGAGEFLLTSLDNDGVKEGFNIDLNRLVAEQVSVPLIASGGAGSMQDFLDVFREAQVEAALAASVFHYSEFSIPELKRYLNANEIEVRL